MWEELVVLHCSPTLAGIKTGSMFSCSIANEETMKEMVRHLNGILVKKGLCVLPLRHKEGRALIYVFRPKYLSRDLQNDVACRLLREKGYYWQDPRRCVVQLIRKLNESADFPHEIGLFLGYPPEDVCGFIDNNAACYKCVGCWKVYGDEKAALKTFARYKKCTETYCACLAEGRTIEALVVAS